jgi:catechol 2,3-dioxygenase-like lactoylglutathione lyase family enzyme
MPTIKRIDHFVLTAKDVDASVAFYTKVLGMTAEQFEPADGTTRWALTFGDNKINLHQAGAEFKPNAKVANVGSQDVCFITDDLLDAWQEHFTHCNVKVEEGPVGRMGAVGKIMSLYIRDPDGNLIEISRYV